MSSILQFPYIVHANCRPTCVNGPIRIKYSPQPCDPIWKWTRISLSDAKKEGKQEPKADKESDVERAKANAALWRLRLDVAEQSLDEYRASTGKLAAANQGLTNQVYRSEKDMMDIMAHLKRKDAETDAKVVALKTFFLSK